MKLAVPQGITRTFGRQVLKTKKNSPHIFFAVGVAGVIGGAVMACKATLKLEKELDEIRRDAQDVKDKKMLAETSYGAEKYSDREYTHDMIQVYTKTMVRFGRLYGPAVVVGGVGVAALTGSHIQLTRRNAALTAAFTAVTKAYEDYRARVRDELGEEKELQIYHCMEDVEIEENGKTKKLTTSQGVLSPYAKLFDESNPNWRPGPDYNFTYIRGVQNQLNRRLEAYGHVMLVEAYDALNLERTPACFVVGWLRDEIGDGDGYIDFGLDKPAAKPFMMGKETNFWLDFNVDGVVYDKI